MTDQPAIPMLQKREDRLPMAPLAQTIHLVQTAMTKRKPLAGFSTIGRMGSFLLLFLLSSCSKDESPKVTPNPVDTTTVKPTPFDINTINDTYEEVAPITSYPLWGPYNVHDPSIIKAGDYFYCYNTDVAFGTDVRPGIQVRKSKDLVEWKFVGWVFDGLPKLGSDLIKQRGGTPVNALWAPYVLKVGSEFRLYYSLSSSSPSTPWLSVIGLATASSPTGPWTEKGAVVYSSQNDNNPNQTNAIDPSVLIDQQGSHWMYYGSALDGIYLLKLDASTGLAAINNDKGKRVARRGSTGNMINGNEEGPEIIYNATLKKYFLFVAYDWLQTKYNVRVARSDSPEGPFLDYHGESINQGKDYGPMIIAPYRFRGHSGWQGTSHCSVFEEKGQFYIAHQARPGVNSYYMDLHVRKLFWTADGWPVASPERYAATEQTTVPLAELTGKWEQIVLGYQVVPGYDKEQRSPNFQEAVDLQLDANGAINGNAANQWTYNDPWLVMTWSNGFTDKVRVERGRDWENKKPCLIFTGLNNEGTAIWGKK